MGLVASEVGDSVVVINVLEVTVTVLVLLTGIGSKGVCDNDSDRVSDGVPVGDVLVSSEVIAALLSVRDEVAAAVD